MSRAACSSKQYDIGSWADNQLQQLFLSLFGFLLRFAHLRVFLSRRELECWCLFDLFALLPRLG